MHQNLDEREQKVENQPDIDHLKLMFISMEICVKDEVNDSVV